MRWKLTPLIPSLQAIRLATSLCVVILAGAAAALVASPGWAAPMIGRLVGEASILAGLCAGGAAVLGLCNLAAIIHSAAGAPEPSGLSGDAGAMRDGSKTLLDTILVLSKAIDAQAHANLSNVNFLHGAGTELTGNLDQGRLRLLVARLVAENLRMREKSNTFEAELSSSKTKIDTLQKNLRTATKEVLTDALTSIGNRRFLDQKLCEQIELARTRREQWCFAIIDVDHFKSVNDRHGHLVGDHLLKHFAASIAASVDCKGHVGRFGGEEFGVILFDASLAKAALFMDNIRSSLASRSWIIVNQSAKIGQITVSIGIAEWHPEDTMTSLVSRADEFLYQAKCDGRNRVRGCETLRLMAKA